MALKKAFSKDYYDRVEPLTESRAHSLRIQSLGGASISLGIVLMLVQKDLDSSFYLLYSFYFAVIALPFWVASAMVVELYIFFGDRSFDYWRKPLASIVPTVFVILSAFLLTASVALLISFVTWVVAFLFVVQVLVLTCWYSKYQRSLTRFLEQR